MSADASPLVSIVTPVYDGEEFIRECVESVLAQTYRNWEYTIVDNCSTDGTLAIAQEYASSDSRIRIVRNQQHLEVISNHNAAFASISSHSKYCKVVFADDWLFPECLERMVSTAEEFPRAGIVGSYVLEGTRVICTGLPYTVRFVTGREICRLHLLNQLYVFGSANGLLFRAGLVRKKIPFLNESNIHADTEVCFELLKSCDFAFVHQVLSYTRVRPGSLTSASNDIQTSYAGSLQILTHHGRHYLSNAEQDGLVSRHLSDYYTFIGKCLLLGRRKAYSYHRAVLSHSEYGFSKLRLIRGIARTLASRVMNLESTLARSRVNNRHSTSAPEVRDSAVRAE